MAMTNRSKDAHPRLKSLYVSTPDGLAGLLTKESRHVFSYATDAVVAQDARRAIALSMPVAAESYQSFPIFPVFQTSLPEGFLKERIVQRFAKTMRMDDMALLALAGGNRVGRLRLSAAPDAVADDMGVESLKDILQAEGSRNLFEDLCDKYLISSSGISGVQPKLVLSAVDDLAADSKSTMPTAKAKANAKSSIGKKATLRAKRLIVKTAGNDYPGLVENEFHCLSIARKAGLDVPEFWLSDDKKRLAIRRFDVIEPADTFLGFEDMVSVQGKINERKYEGSYEGVALAVERNASPACLYASLRSLFEAVVLSVVLRNGDAHLKNFGLLYTSPASEDCRLSPLYDVICTTAYLPRDQMALKLAKTKAWPNRRVLLEYGKRNCHVADAERVLERVADAVAEYRPASGRSGIWMKMRGEMEIGLGAVRKI